MKIDRSFVTDLETDVDAASLVASIVSMGRTLGLELVAEAVVSLSHLFRRNRQPG
ncbi:MAG: hypothetical protein CVU16_02035 [Betaproteobacteria bacterium HGW-Betaproteobacteria-10]|nr:MAG: hypothetical protein CVU16_02035 [Betaproteobacteria bacterium HGW-Betaproteobacteria-10]